MRRAIWALGLLVTVVAVAACGSSSSSGSAGSGAPLATELSYFPSTAPLVAVMATDPSGPAYRNAGAFLNKFPLARFGIQALEAQLNKQGVNYDTDLRPLLGNPVAIGTSQLNSSAGGSDHFTAAFVANDAGKLKAQLVDQKPAPKSIGKYDGVDLYRESAGDVFAIDGATVVLSDSQPTLKSALDTHAHNQGLSADQFKKAFTGLPGDALLRMYGNFQGILNTANASKAKQVPWVAALRSFATTIRADAAGLNIDYRIDTSGTALQGSQLPLTGGSSAPRAALQDKPVVVALHDPAQLITFIEGAAAATDPAGYAKVLQQSSKLGIDLRRDLTSQLTGDGEIVFPGPKGKGIELRADVADPAAVTRTLSKIKSLRPIGGGFFVNRTGAGPEHYGVANGKLVMGDQPVAELKAFAAAPATPLAGAKGPLAFRVQLSALLSAGVFGSSAENQIVAGVINQFGPLTGWTANRAGQLYGNVTLPLK